MGLMDTSNFTRKVEYSFEQKGRDGGSIKRFNTHFFVVHVLILPLCFLRSVFFVFNDFSQNQLKLHISIFITEHIIIMVLSYI